MRRARAGDVETAARCKLALRGIVFPTPLQMAGAQLEALEGQDIQRIRMALLEEET